MSILQSYPLGTPKKGDYIIGTSMPVANSDETPITRNFPVDSIIALGNAPNVVTATFTITDAQIKTLGTVPVDILPGVSGHIYEILGVTTTSINSGGLADSYDWSASGNGVIYGRTFSATEHRVEIPNASLPAGGALIGGTYVATPIAGDFRHDSRVKVGTTLGVDPTIPVGQTPVAQWVINITYRLIQVE